MKQSLPLAQAAVSAAVLAIRVLAIVVAGHAERIAASPIELVQRRPDTR